MIDIGLKCRLDAYAKLSVQGGGSENDDFLKKILTSQKDILIDLGYKDIKTNKEIFAIRRSLSFNTSFKKSNLGKHVVFGRNIDKVYYFGGNLTSNCTSRDVVKNNSLSSGLVDIFVPSNKDDFQLYVDCGEISSQYTAPIILFTYRSSDGEPMETFSFDLDSYMIVSLINEEDKNIGTSVFVDNEDRFNFNIVYDNNCTISLYDETSQEVVETGENVLIYGHNYTLNVSYDSELYNLDYVDVNNISVNTPYSFVCDEDIFVSASASEKPIENVVLRIQNMSDYNFEVNDEETHVIESGGFYDLVLNEDVYLNIISSGYNIGSVSASFSGRYRGVDHENSPVTCVVNEYDKTVVYSPANSEWWILEKEYEYGNDLSLTIRNR